MLSLLSAQLQAVPYLHIVLMLDIRISPVLTAVARKDVASSHGIEMVVAAINALAAKSSLVLEHALNIISNMMATAGASLHAT